MQESFNRGADGSAKRIIVLCIVLFSAFIYWAHSTHLDMVTRGQGRVVVTGQNQSVQVAQRGTITQFHTHVGDQVQIGQLLAEISPTDAAAILGETQQRIETMQLRLARLDAELADQPFEIEQEVDAEKATLINAERQLMQARQANLVAKEHALAQTRQQKERELEAIQAELKGAQHRDLLLKEEADQILPLVKIGALGISEKFRIERDQNDISTRKQILHEKIESLRFSIAETQAEIEASRTADKNEIFAQRADVIGQISELSERLPSLRQKVNQTEIQAPISGTINQVFFNIPGAVVSEGEVIAEIVPSDGKLLIEALVLPEDIANVEPGQLARISLTAYDAARYGTVEGKVIRVSADASFREETQTRMFVVETSLDTELHDQDGQTLSILPGMVAQIDIVRGQRSVLDYFWNPVAKVQDRAFRE